MSEKASPDEEELVPEDDAVIGRALRWSLVGLLGLALIGALIAYVLWPQEAPPEEVLVKRVERITGLVPGESAAPPARFTDVTAEAGIDFEHFSGASGEKLLPETMGGGAAFFDYDGDGDQDLFFVNGAPLSPSSDSLSAGGPGNRLYRNDGHGRFEDVTEGSGLEGGTYGMGVAVGDYDGDGRIDVFVTGIGANHLYRNSADGFVDVSARAGVAGDADQWTTGAGFFDCDGDQDLDLFVCRYVRWSREIDAALAFTLNGVDRAYGPPLSYGGAFSTLFRNQGDGTFTDVSERSGIRVTNVTGAPMGKALGVVFGDFDGDGDQDLVVANDTVQNHFFRNAGDGTFEEIGALVGIGFDGFGNATGAMGIDLADYRNDGGTAVCIGNFANEMSSLFVTEMGKLRFSDDAMGEGIGSPSRQRLSFGILFLDYDLDGRQDLLQINGHLEETINQVQPSQHYRQPPQLFWNAGPDRPTCFVEVPPSDGGDLDRELAGRGSSYADIDGDGDQDVLVCQVAARPLLLRNDQALGHHWLRVRLVGRPPNTGALGAQVLVRAGGVTQRRYVTATRSYLSQSELPLTFGLGKRTAIDTIEVVWPDGERQSIDAPAELDRELVIRR
jgi:hypothetical protein